MLVLNLTNCLKSVGCAADRSSVVGFVGDCHYYHYGAQQTEDQGWGCGYRTLQTILSWYQLKEQKLPCVPTLRSIQDVLINIGDKPEGFRNSRGWIGAFECGLIIQTLVKHDFRILHIPDGRFLDKDVHTLSEHFHQTGSPVMMGGRDDNFSKGILAISVHPLTTMLLVCNGHPSRKGGLVLPAASSIF
ncbi:unnamed protein product [Calicophoron daubneyi]|uniref:UFSP1/2/DUB catalytic domain-containing protein n=1 Tax=Calicophoron daubneyi TaxID=300641 RepID=A0AAV2TRG0_CALDB